MELCYDGLQPVVFCILTYFSLVVCCHWFPFSDNNKCRREGNCDALMVIKQGASLGQVTKEMKEMLSDQRTREQNGVRSRKLEVRIVFSSLSGPQRGCCLTFAHREINIAQ